jgi:hypothetical protein
MDDIEEPAEPWVIEHFEGTSLFLGDVLAATVDLAERLCGELMVDAEREAFVDRYRRELALWRSIGDPDSMFIDRFSRYLAEGLRGRHEVYTKFLTEDPQSHAAPNN